MAPPCGVNEYCDYIQYTNINQHIINELLIKDVEYEAWLAFTTSVVMTPGGKKIWELMKIQLTPSVAKAMDDYISANPDAPSFLDINPLFRAEKESNTP